MKKLFIPLILASLLAAGCNQTIESLATSPVEQYKNLTIRNKIHAMFYDKSVTDADIVSELKKEKDPMQALKTALPAKSNKFTKQGQIASFDMTATYKTRHAILYYIPKTVKIISAPETYQTLVFLHGGGASTATYQDAKDTAQMYLEDFLSFAEQTRTILVFPSSSIGWNAPTRFFMRELLALMRKELPLNPNKILISGHSMGAMGLTREGSFLADLFNGIEPLSGGTQENYAKPEWLKSYFNVPYTHINGKNDHFEMFHTRMLDVAKKITQLEKDLDMKSKFTYFQHPGDHNYDLPITFKEYEKLYTVERNLFQKKLFGTFYYINLDYPKLGFDLTGQKVARYFWIEGDDIGNTPVNTANTVSFDADIKDNTITVTTTVDQSLIKKMTINLSKEMVDMSRPVKIIWDGNTAFEGMVQADLAKTVEIARRHQDHSYLFEAGVKITR